MNILEKIDYVTRERLDEGGLRNIKELARTHKEAEIYFHQDTDGVTSAISIKTYLESYGVKTVDTHVINYGDMEYSVVKPKPHTLHVMVDFAHGKDAVMHIHTDHHEGQVGVAKSTSTAFVHSASNNAYLSAILPKSDAFPQEDLKLISMVDSADYVKNDITPDDVMRAAFKTNPDITVEKNRTFMGLVVNKLLLAYKNKKEFLEKLVLMSKPSLINMYVTIKYLAQQSGYRSPEELQTAMDKYVDVQKGLMKPGNMNDIKTMKTGVNMSFGTIIVQYGSSMLTKPNVLYDRYTVFKNNPDSRYLVMVWPMGLIQVSKNPFSKIPNPYHLGDLAKNVLKNYESILRNKKVTLDYIKWAFEKKVTDESMGFTLKDFIALFEKVAVGDTSKLGEIVDQLGKDLSYSDKNLMKSVYVTAWDIIQAQSGGHKEITNLSGISLYGKGYKDMMMDIVTDIVKDLDQKVNG